MAAHVPAAGPLVSVVMATYNRSNILPLVVETVRRQTYVNWELLIVGDRCTDDTESVVARIGDSRIRFWNEPVSAGEQSGPNNAGCRAARGRYLAFLNHDDFWMTRHLERCVAALEADSGIDLVYGLNVAVQPGGRFALWGPTPPGAKVPDAGVPASAWMFRRELLDRVGPWRPARDAYLVPSQDWLRRASRVAVLRSLAHFAVLSLPSNSRRGSYADRLREEHEIWSTRMTGDPHWAEDLLAELLIARDLSSAASGNTRAILPFALRALKNTGKRALAVAGVSSVGAVMWLRYGRRGGFIDHARRVRGLPPLAGRPRP